MARANDPFYLLRQEITDQVNDLQTRMAKFHGLTATNPERKQIASKVEKDCDSINWQLNELQNAVDKASQDPQKFNLTPEELGSRGRWIDNTRRQVNGIKETLRTATTPSAALSAAQEKYAASNNQFINNESEKQQLLLKNQDQSFEELEQQVIRIGRIGKAIGEEMEGQDKLLTELDQDVDTTHSRLRATSKKMQDLIRKSGSNTQLAVIVFLIVVLIILAVFAFS